MKTEKQLSRREMMARAGLAVGGVVAAGALQACGSDDDTTAAPEQPTGPQVSEFPYDQHIAASYQLDVAAVREAAYQAYYNGGCCHGAYSALLGHLAQTSGAPFDKLPIDFGKFGAGGIAGYGSICGSILGGVLLINMIVSKAAVRGAMMTDLMRWYEDSAFPQFVPATIAANEAGKTTLDFSAGNIVNLQVVPKSHLCHASVSTWCADNGVSASSPDKLARCSRLTADVAGKAAEMINTYLATGAYTGAPLDAASQGCVTCHPATSPAKPTATGMQCGSCHSDKAAPHWTAG